MGTACDKPLPSFFNRNSKYGAIGAVGGKIDVSAAAVAGATMRRKIGTIMGIAVFALCLFGSAGVESPGHCASPPSM